MNRTTVEGLWALAVIVAVLVVGGLLTLTGVTTHASHVQQIKYNDAEMLACIQSDRTAAECRVIVYGSY